MHIKVIYQGISCISYHLQTSPMHIKTISFTDKNNTNANTKHDQKVVGQQVTLDDGRTLNLGFTSVATKTDDTLLEIIISKLDQLASSFNMHTRGEDRGVYYTKITTEL